VFVGERLVGALRPPSSRAGLWSSLGGVPCLLPGLQPAGGLPRLLEILLAGAPEEQASGDPPDGDQNIELCGTQLSWCHPFLMIAGSVL
jgi:hypothetical protein